DPYHSSPNWRKPYPGDEAAQLKKLIDKAEMNHVDFVWAVHPGKDIKWNDEDRAVLLHKFELMYDLGIRSYAV
ncbi:beta-N-acetylglucosaminidase domain-containing protein, partial [Gelidibacter salicanalis]